jgi:hypothetical protein
MAGKIVDQIITKGHETRDLEGGLEEELSID